MSTGPADHQNKPYIGPRPYRAPWYDPARFDLITDVINSGFAPRRLHVRRRKNRHFDLHRFGFDPSDHDQWLAPITIIYNLGQPISFATGIADRENRSPRIPGTSFACRLCARKFAVSRRASSAIARSGGTFGRNRYHLVITTALSSFLSAAVKAKGPKVIGLPMPGADLLNSINAAKGLATSTPGQTIVAAGRNDHGGERARARRRRA